MNLYKLLFEHWSQKDSEQGIKGFFLAEDDEAAYEFIKNTKFEYGDPLYNYNSWDEFEEWNGYNEPDEEGEENYGFMIQNDDWEVIGMETFKERMIRLGGEMFDDEHELCDLYYGVTRYGWECVGKIRADEIRVLKNVGVLK